MVLVTTLRVPNIILNLELAVDPVVLAEAEELEELVVTE